MMEEQVIGALLLQPDLLAECDLSPEHFEHESLRGLYATILEYAANGSAVDVITVGEAHPDQFEYLNRLTQDAVLANFGAKVAKVREAHRERKAREIGQALKDGWDTDQAVRALMELDIQRRSFDHDSTAMVKAATAKLDALQEGVRGVPTGIAKLDDSLGGFHASDLIVVGARPSMGKTAFMLCVAEKCGVPVGVISGEQPTDQVGFRMLALKSRVSVHRMRTGTMSDDDWTQVTKAGADVRQMRIWVNDRPAIRIEDLCRQARKWAMRNQIKLLCVDYIQKIKADGQDRRNEVAAVVVALKDLARELQIPVLAMAQVNRGVESRQNKRPGVSDLKEAGEIEQEADQIILLYRDEVYDNSSQDKGVAELIVGKNRHGPTGTIRTAWIGEYMAFRNLDGRAA